ncbi:MAG: M28 family peptidase [Bacteroides sp.]|nr:M28 family peptidase [Bacteroides sp.]
MRHFFLTLSLSAIISLCGCRQAGNATTTATNPAEAAEASRNQLTFNADSAYSYIKKQVEFGPRVPGTDSHRRCAEWLAEMLALTSPDSLIVQNAQVSAFTGDELPITNIMAMYNTKATDRVILAAHYDTRPWADNEADQNKRNTPISGANDGASGVGALLEIARIIGENRPEIGVDILLVDAEDYGDSGGFSMHEDSWCLGTQYWAEHMPYTDANRPRYGIVLDMIAGTNARFHREFFSDKTARSVVDKVWGEATRNGLSQTFINEVGGSIVDDHIFIDRAGIPCIDIVECNNAITRSFPPTWHTLHDDLACIDINPLRAVGQTVLNVIMREKPSAR